MDPIISPHVSYTEATATSTGLPNTPGENELSNMRALASAVFEPLRRMVGGPIGISSFYRSPEVNRRVGGAATSQHVKGEAVDLDMGRIRLPKATNEDLFEHLRLMDFDQLIWEFGTRNGPDWVHVSYRRDGHNRKQVLRAVRNRTGKTSYIAWS